MFNPNDHMMQLKGKDYLPVAWRLVWFREDHPDWCIDPAIIELDADHAVFRAAITDENGILKCAGHGSESKRDFGDYMEKAETKAVGRALAMLGYGTQFTDTEFDEGERIVDSPVDRGRKAPAQPAKPKAKEAPAPAQNAPEKPAEPPKLADEYQKEYIRKNASDALYEALMAQYGADLENLTDEAAESARDQIDNNRPMSVTCERCGNPITGVAMKDGTVMNGAELVGKSKLKYGGVYCFNCMKELSKKRKAS